MFATRRRPAFRRVILIASIAGLLTSKADAANIFLRGSDPLNSTSFNNALAAPLGWSNDSAPTAGNNYFTGAFALRTPTGTGSATFAGTSLSIDTGGSLSFKGSGVYTVNNLILNGGAIIQADVNVASPNNIATLAGSITVTAQSTFYTSTGPDRIINVQSVIHGTGGITVAGNVGSVGAVNFLNTANDFTGVLTLGGTIPLIVPALTNGGIAGALGAASANAGNLFFDGGPLRINGATSSSTNRLFTLTTRNGAIDSAHATAAVSFTNTGAIAIGGTGARTLTFTGVSTGANTFAPIIGENGGATSVIKTGTGNWELTGANTYTGATTINGGTLSFSSINNFGVGTALNMGGGTLLWKTGNTVDVSTSRTLTLMAGDSGLHTNGQSITLAGAIGGAGGLAKKGAGTLTLSGANTFSGDVSVGSNAGTIRITNSQSLGAGSKIVSVIDTVGGANPPSLVLAGGSGAIVLPGSISFSASNDASAANSAIVNESGTNTIDGDVRLAAGGGGTRFTVNGGSLTVNGALYCEEGLNRTAYLGGSGNGIVNGGIFEPDFDGQISVTKTGAGTWILNGPNYYTGPTVVSQGTLIVSSDSGGMPVTVGSGSTFGVRVSGLAGSLVAQNLNYSGGSSGLVIDFGGFESTETPAIETGTFSPQGTVTVRVSGMNFLSGDTVPLVAYDTLGGSGFAGLALSLPPRATGSLVNNTLDKTIDLVLTAYDFPRWTGAINGNWNTTTQNWRTVDGDNSTAYIQNASGSDSVLFDDVATGTANVALVGTITPSAILVQNTVKDYIFSGTGKLSGTTGLVKDGPGKLTIANTGGNDFNGQVAVVDGILQVGDGVTVGGGQFGAGPILNDATIVFNRPDNFSVSNAIFGAGELVKSGTNVVTLLSDSRFEGNVTVNNGTLRLGADFALGAVDGSTEVKSGATLDINGALLFAGEEVNIQGSGVGNSGAVVNHGVGGSDVGIRYLTLLGNASIGGTQRWDIGAFTYDGEEYEGQLLGDGFTLTKVGTNEIRLRNLGETELGGIVISEGILIFEGNSTLGNSPGTVTVSAGGTLGLVDNVAVNSKPISVQGGRILAGSSTNTLSGAVTLAANSTLEAASGATLTLAGSIAGPGGFAKTDVGTVRLEGSANTFTGQAVVTAGTLLLSKTSGAAIVGEVTVNGGSLSVGAINQFGPNAGVTINEGGTWSNASNFSQTLKNFTVNTATTQSLNNLTVTNLLLVDESAHDINSGASLTANTLSITSGASLRLGANTDNTSINVGAGGLILVGGTLQLGNAGGAFSANANLGGNVTSSGVSAISAPNFAGPRVLDLQGSVRTFNVSDGTMTIAPSIQNGGLIKNGVGTLVLAGTSSYLGSTTVNAGTLVVNGAISGSTVAVENGGKLRGDGSTGPVTVQAGGTLSSDADLVPLTVSALTFAPSAKFSIEINGANTDAVTVNGSANLFGTIALEIAISAAAMDGHAYTLINSNGISGYAGGGRFAYAGNVLDEGERFTVTSGSFAQEFAISYLADAGKDLVLTAVPEPGSVGSLLGAMTLLGLRRRRKD